MPSAASAGLVAPTISRTCLLYTSEITRNETSNASVASKPQTEDLDRQTGLVTEQILNSEIGEIHYSYYLPDNYSDSREYPMMVVMPGYDMMWFGEDSSGSNLNWNGFRCWMGLDEEMIVVSAQLTDWGETSAREAVELTEYFIDSFSVDTNRIYAAGYSAGGETMSRAVSMRPDLYAAYLDVYKRQGQEGAKLARENKVDLILAVGGGSVMDCCKAVSLASRYDGSIWDEFWARPGVIDFEPLPLGVIVTVAGTGSECNGGAVITNEEKKIKTGRDYPQLNPRFALMDPTYTFSVPIHQMVSGGFDILSHIMETYFSEPNEDNVSDDIMEALMRSVIRNLRASIQDPKNYTARKMCIRDRCDETSAYFIEQSLFSHDSFGSD